MLNNLVKVVHKRKRIGRGGSRGGTSGAGHKGQKARTGSKVRTLFEGGQLPLFRRLPKRGFNNDRFGTNYEIINLDVLERVFESGDQVTREVLIEKGIIHGKKGWLLKVLGRGELSKSLIVHADAVSEAAAQAITQRNGKINLIVKE